MAGSFGSGRGGSSGSGESLMVRSRRSGSSMSDTRSGAPVNGWTSGGKSGGRKGGGWVACDSVLVGGGGVGFWFGIGVVGRDERGDVGIVGSERVVKREVGGSVVQCDAVRAARET